ncbi:MAG: hypothetical protein OEL53_09585 [Rhodospirillales bacterium]|nr:hypothetical protein [Rhodospirillales bacterium]
MKAQRNTTKRKDFLLDPLKGEEEFIVSFKKAAAAFSKKHAATKETARKQLIKEGFLTKKGNLSKLYYGG